MSEWLEIMWSEILRRRPEWQAERVTDKPAAPPPTPPKRASVRKRAAPARGHSA